MQPYPELKSEEPKDIAKVIKEITRERDSDVTDFTNLTSIFIRGRKVAKVPSASNDVVATDRLGDFNATATYLYILIDNSGAEWRRVALASW